jgi:hypothetical protein
MIIRVWVVLLIVLGLGVSLAGGVLLITLGSPDIAIELIGLGANIVGLSYATIFLSSNVPRMKVNRSGVYVSICLFIGSAFLFGFPALLWGIMKVYAPIALILAAAVAIQLSARRIQQPPLN